MFFEREDGVEAAARIAGIEKEEMAVAGSFVLCSVISVRKEGQEVVPIFVVGINVHGEHVCQCAVGLLGETVRLRMVRARMAKLHFTQAKDLSTMSAVN